jgi:hypothetical protein
MDSQPDSTAALDKACFEFSHLLRPASGSSIQIQSMKLSLNLEKTVIGHDEFSAFLEQVL